MSVSVRNSIIGFALVAPLLALGVTLLSIPAAIGLLFVSHMLILYPTLRPECDWLGPVVTRFRTQNREVWLTIDDGPDADTPELLELLAQYDAKATFFLIACKAAAHPDRVRAILAAGHTIENHTLSHPSGSFWCLGPRRIRAQVEEGNEVLTGLIDTKPRLFRAPAGMKNPFVHPVLARNDLQLVAWSARGIDGVPFHAKAMVDRIMKDVSPGAIILVHQGHEGDTTHASSLDGIRLLLDGLKADDYRCLVPSNEDLCQ